MVHMKGTVKGMEILTYHGPYRVVTVTGTNAEVHLVDDPTADSIFVSLDRVKPCYPELPDISWTGHMKRKAHKNNDPKEQDSRSSENQKKAIYWTYHKVSIHTTEQYVLNVDTVCM